MLEPCRKESAKDIGNMFNRLKRRGVSRSLKHCRQAEELSEFNSERALALGFYAHAFHARGSPLDQTARPRYLTDSKPLDCGHLNSVFSSRLNRITAFELAAGTGRLWAS